MKINNLFIKIKIVKFLRFSNIYGIKRAIVKSVGNLNISFPIWFLNSLKLPLFKKKVNIGLIGCGHFAFTSIAYYLSQKNSINLIWCYDTNIKASKRLAKSYNIKSIEENISNDFRKVDIVYIVSNHSTHAKYAVDFMKKGCDVYIEKPIATSWDQLTQIINTKKQTNKNIYLGYNRPFSPGILKIKKYLTKKTEPISLSCFITGHFLDADHWYRNTDEGTRICGNLGHWIDLSVHFLGLLHKKFSKIELSITYSDKKLVDENIIVNMVTENKDLISIIFSARNEPFEGVNETINFQCGDLIAKIDDHRQTHIWVGHKKYNFKHRPKDVGHKNAILQPFNNKFNRDWDELIISSKLMLTISDMVKDRELYRVFKI
tara:strand:+ start:653 stop:1777 length:1125 start_codon:yes stop_codon:yes gene_type:complete